MEPGSRVRSTPYRDGDGPRGSLRSSRAVRSLSACYYFTVTVTAAKFELVYPFQAAKVNMSLPVKPLTAL